MARRARMRRRFRLRAARPRWAPRSAERGGGLGLRRDLDRVPGDDLGVLGEPVEGRQGAGREVVRRRRSTRASRRARRCGGRPPLPGPPALGPRGHRREPNVRSASELPSVGIAASVQASSVARRPPNAATRDANPEAPGLDRCSRLSLGGRPGEPDVRAARPERGNVRAGGGHVDLRDRLVRGRDGRGPAVSAGRAQAHGEPAQPPGAVEGIDRAVSRSREKERRGERVRVVDARLLGYPWPSSGLPKAIAACPSDAASRRSRQSRPARRRRPGRPRHRARAWRPAKAGRRPRSSRAPRRASRRRRRRGTRPSG